MKGQLAVYEYFISYVFQSRTGISFGSSGFAVHDPITSLEQIRAYETDLRRQGYDNATVLGFSLLNGSENR